MPTLKSVKLLCHRVLRGAPQTPRIRYCPPSSFPKPSSILVFSSVHRSRLRYRPPSSFSALFTGFVSETVLSPVSLLRSPSSSPEPSSILVFSPVHRIRLRNRPPSSFSALFTGFVSVTVLHPCLRNRPPSSFSAALFFGGYY